MTKRFFLKINLLILAIIGISAGLSYSVLAIGGAYGESWAFAVLFSVIFILVNGVLVLLKALESDEDDLF